MGTAAVEPKQTNIQTIITSVTNELAREIKKQNQKIVVSVAKDIPKFRSEPNLIRIAIQNLVSNAIKYTPQKGDIEITAHYNKNSEMIGRHKIPHSSVVLSVKDNGFGIPKNERNRIFEKMFRATNARVKNTDGTGLGLYMVKMLCGIFKGDVWFTSKEDSGSTFYLVLPTKVVIKKVGSKNLET
jgi:two-component system sensor histidine kinase VicK